MNIRVHTSYLPASAPCNFFWLLTRLIIKIALTFRYENNKGQQDANHASFSIYSTFDLFFSVFADEFPYER